MSLKSDNHVWVLEDEFIPDTSAFEYSGTAKQGSPPLRPGKKSLHVTKYFTFFTICITLGVLFAQYHNKIFPWRDLYLGHSNLQQEELEDFRSIDPLAGCRPEDVTTRREWSTLPLEDRKAFTAAVNCLYDLPTKLDSTIFPGARNRYDDFVTLHINMTLVIHFSGFFLPWHRHFLWLWNNALRNECGYKGDIPYWQWEKYADDIRNNPLFDGSDGSMSGDGLFDGLNRTGPDPGFKSGPLPRGNGGGCLHSGPFKGRMMNMGPYAWEILHQDPPALPADWAAYRPRCLTRDLTPEIARDNHNETVIKDLLHKPETLGDWLVALQGSPVVESLTANPHAGGHFVMGGAGADFFASPADPSFYLHHSNVDRVWLQWVALDQKRRQYALHGTHTIFNKPPSPELTIYDTLDLGIEDDGSMVIKDVLDRVPYCYKYDDE